MGISRTTASCLDATFLVVEVRVRLWRNRDLQRDRTRCLLQGGGKADLYGRHKAQSGRSRMIGSDLETTFVESGRCNIAVAGFPKPRAFPEMPFCGLQLTRRSEIPDQWYCSQTTGSPSLLPKGVPVLPQAIGNVTHDGKPASQTCFRPPALRNHSSG